MKLKNLSSEHVIIGILLLSFLILRIPSIFEPHWNEIEGTLTATAEFVRSGETLYVDVYADKLPLTYVLYLIPTLFGSFSLIAIKVLNLIAGMFSIYFLYSIVKTIYKNIQLPIVASVLAIIFLGVPILEANVGYIENFIVLGTLLSIYLIVRRETHTYLSLLGIGFSIGIVSLIDLSSVAFAMLLLTFTLVTKIPKKNRQAHIVYLCSSALLPWVGMLALFGLTGHLQEFIEYAIQSPLQTISQTNDAGLGFLFFNNTLLARTLIVAVATVILVVLRRRDLISERKFLVGLWISATLYSVYFYQGATNNSHVLIPLVPIGAAILAQVGYKSLTTRNIEYILKAFALGFLGSYMFIYLLTLGSGFNKDLGIRSYYNNFYKYLIGQRDTTSYTQYFGQDTYNRYQINAYLSQNYPENTNVYILTDNPWIYAFGDISSENVQFLTEETVLDNYDEFTNAILPSKDIIVVEQCKSKLGQRVKTFLMKNEYQVTDEVNESCVLITNAFL